MKRNTQVTCQNCGKEETVYTSRSKTYKYCSINCMSQSYLKIKIILGEKINNWEIISKDSIRKNGRTYVLVKCTCGSNIEKKILIKHVLSKKEKGCEKCSRFHTSKGFGLVSGEYWSQVKSRAFSRNLDFNITIEYAWNLFLKQNKKCALSDIDIEFEPNCVHKKNIDNRIKRTASLDRIDSKKEYIEGNIQWVHKDVNIMKNKFNQNYFLDICTKISNKNLSK